MRAPLLFGGLGAAVLLLGALLPARQFSHAQPAAPAKPVAAPASVTMPDLPSYVPPIGVDARGVTCSHGYAAFGTLKYGPDFKHFDYVKPDAPKGGTYRFAMQQSSFDTVTQYGLLGNFPISLIYIHDALMEPSQDEPASRYPLIAQRVCYPRDRSWFEFYLDPRARWNDGVPLTVDDVLFTVMKAKTTIGVSLRRISEAVERAERTGPNSVRLTLTQKNNPTLPTVVMDMQILPKHHYEKHELTAATLVPPVNSGPYRIAKLSAGRWIEFHRVTDYWAADLPVNRGRNNFDIIRHDFYRDAIVANEAFLAGLEDAKFESSASRWDVEARLPAFRAGEIRRTLIRYGQPSLFMGLILNSRRPALADRRVRQALLLAYDFEWVNRVLLGGRHGRLPSYFPNSEFEAHGLPSPAEVKLLAPFRADLPEEVFTRPVALPVGGSWEKRRANMLKAASLLKAAGYQLEGGRLIDPQTGRPMVLNLLAYSALMDRQVSLLTENARQLGIEIRFRSADSAQLRHMMRHYNFDLLLGVPTLATSNTPGVGLLQMWSSKAADTPQQLNYPGAKNPAIDAMILDVVRAQDRASVVNAMRALDRILQWNYYAIPFQHNYPALLGHMPVTYWDRFGRPKIETTYNFNIMTLDNWWYDPARDARLKHRQTQ